MRQALIQYGFFPQVRYSLLAESFPAMPQTSAAAFRGDRDLRSSDAAFAKASPAWQDFRREIFSIGFWQPYLTLFPELRSYSLDRFDPNFDEDAEPRTQAANVQYARMDIGWGGAGYGRQNGGRGVHLDSRKRVISGLLYFSDQSTMSGGEFEFWTAPKGEMVQRVALRENMAILSVQNLDGWHRVRPVESVEGYRKFVYFALCDTAGKSRHWAT